MKLLRWITIVIVLPLGVMLATGADAPRAPSTTTPGPALPALSSPAALFPR
jgi:hypothetical protein